MKRAASILHSFSTRSGDMAKGASNGHARIPYMRALEKTIAEKYDSSRFPNQSLPRDDWRELTEKGILLSLIPKEYGGRDSHAELCDIIEMTSRYNLPIGMYTMIVTALFVRNVSKYGSDEVKREVFSDFSQRALIGGFALTEPGCGSNLAKMTTTFEKKSDGYHIKGSKHWQAFSLTADWWLVAAKEADAKSKTVSHFIMKRSEGFKTLTEYKALGLKAIDYGLNTVDAVIPLHRKLDMPYNNLKDTLEMLCASRLSMAAMASGFIYRVHKDAVARTDQRPMGTGALSDLGFVQVRLNEIAANQLIARSMFLQLRDGMDFRDDLNQSYFQAQAIKVLATDKMLESALSYQQLCGGEGYRVDTRTNNAAFAVLDARVYTIFDGTNDLLSQQLTDYLVKTHANVSLSDALKSYAHTRKAFEHVDCDLTVINDVSLHENRVYAGRIISRLFGIQTLVEMSGNAANKVADVQFDAAVGVLVADIKKTLVEMAHTGVLMNTLEAAKEQSLQAQLDVYTNGDGAPAERPRAAM